MLDIRIPNIKFSKKLTKRKITSEIIIHCSATKEGFDCKVESIHRHHLKNGWSGIGYNYVIDINGTIWEGRPENTVGAHCTNHNSKSIGICYVGGLGKDGKPKDTRNDKQLLAMAELCSYLHEKYPDATFHGHCEFANKSCPCFDVKSWIETLNFDKKNVVEPNKSDSDISDFNKEDNTNNTGKDECLQEKGFFSAIIEFFRNLFI